MFESLTDRLQSVFRSITGRGKISEANVTEVMEQIRLALIEADVNFTVAQKFCDDVKQKAIGAEVVKTLSPEQVMVKIVHDELVRLMGPVDPRIPFVSGAPTLIMMAGLQGSGKTTTCGKLALQLTRQGKRPLMVAADLKRPAAIDQLETLGRDLAVATYAERDHQNVLKVCQNGLARARQLACDVIILDTAGRLAIDDELMRELEQVANVIQPHQIYLVVDAMTGQDAVNTAKHFNDRLELDAVILTKFDSDTRGGAALSVKSVTGKPIKFIGTGEKMDKLEDFRPEGIAGRILGMGDIVQLVKQAEATVDQEKAAQLQAKMAKGTFNFNDFLTQIEQMQKMGSFKDLLKLIPGVSGMMKQLDQSQFDDKQIHQMKAIVQSMTAKERENPDILDGGRRRRIARGSGTTVQDVAGLVKHFEQARDMMRAMAGMGLRDRLRMGSALTQYSMQTGRMPSVKLSGFSAAPGRYKDAKERQRDREKKKRAKR